MGLSKLPRKKLIALLDAYARQALSVDGYWFMGVEDKYGYEATFEIDHKAWEKLSAIEGHRVAEALGIKKGNASEILDCLEVSPFSLSLGPKIEKISENKGIFYLHDCRIQKNRIKMGRTEFACKPVGLTWVTNFATAINPQAKVSCVFCPPDAHPDDVWCQWEIET